ncbi:MAG: 2-dehydropantoate 2-reductase [Chloroflexota bacterium]|nr:MAG: 2-dehydropantoate 2-reductase [Chloroflexota bacterium]
MKIAIFGTGGVGGYFGGLLAQAGYDVSFISRGKQLAAIRRAGLRIRSVNGDFHLDQVNATGEPGDIGPVDYILLAVKHYHLDSSIDQLQPLVGTRTTIVPLLNGVDAHEKLIEVYGTGPVVGGLCSLVSMVEEPGVIYQPSKLRRVVIGELDNSRSERVESIVQALERSGAEAIHSENIQVAIWTKFMFISSFGGVSSLSRATVGEFLGCPATRSLFIQAMQEVDSLARVQDINLAIDAVEKNLEMADGFVASATSSMQRDVEAGNLFELEAFSGTIITLGEKFDIPTPVHAALYALLLPALLRAEKSHSR